MSDREKKLVLFFAIAGFAILNFFGYNFMQSTRLEVERERDKAKSKLEIAEKGREASTQNLDEMKWLDEHEPEPAENQDVQTKLSQFAEREAKAAGLTIKTQKLLPTDAGGKYYNRAKLQIVLTGTEEALYGWFDHINAPDQLRIASQIRLSPNTDDTKIDCTATVEQWFVPPQT